MTLKEVVELIKSRGFAELPSDRAKRGKICPVCGSGSGKSGTGILPLPSGNGYKCFACNTSGDYLGFMAKKYSLDMKADFRDIVERTAAEMGIEIDNQAQPAGAKAPAMIPTKDQVERAQKAITTTPAASYLQKRGIRPETAQRNGLGYYEKNGFGGILTPTNGGGYVLRYIQNPRLRVQNLGAAGLFNAESLEQETPVFITEGVFDALSYLDCGFYALALNSTANAGKLVELLKTQIKDNGGKITPRALILSLDNDEPGHKAADSLGESLGLLGVPFITITPPENEGKDPNEWKNNDPGKFQEMAAESLQKAETAEKEKQAAERERLLQQLNECNARGLLYRLKAEAAQIQNTTAVNTGFPGLNKILGGGLYPGLYALGAKSGFGKTTFLLQIADYIAQTRQAPILYFALEMGASELIAKSISRISYEEAVKEKFSLIYAKTARQILTGDKWLKPNEDRLHNDLTTLAIEKYEREYSGQIYYFESIGEFTVDYIIKNIKDFSTASQLKPVVIVDYLQLIQAEDPRQTDKQAMDKNILKLKRLSRELGIIVIVISAFNRESYKDDENDKKKSPKPGIASFKESGAIEYTADVAIVMYKKDGSDKITVEIAKNRLGTKGEIDLTFKGMFSYFTEKEEMQDPGDPYGGLPF